MNHNDTMTKPDSVAASTYHPKRRHSSVVNPSLNLASLANPKLALRRAQTHVSTERLCGSANPSAVSGGGGGTMTKVKTLVHQNERGGGSNTSLCDHLVSGGSSRGQRSSTRKEDGGGGSSKATITATTTTKGREVGPRGQPPQRSTKYSEESVSWQEFIDYILSINSDIGAFRKKRRAFGVRDPSDDYVSTVVEEIADRTVVWAGNLHPKRKGDDSKKNKHRPPGGMSKEASKLPLNASLKEESATKEKSGDASGGVSSASTTAKERADLQKETVDTTTATVVAGGGNANSKNSKNRRQSNEVHTHGQVASSSQPISSRSDRERRHTICGNDTKDIFAPKYEKTDGDSGGGSQGKPASKWTVVRADLEDHHLKKLQADKLEGWDFLAHTMSAMGNQTSTRQILYMRYLRRPNDWRQGLSPRAWDQCEYIFSEADLMKKDAFRWKNMGVKPPSLSDRIQQKYRPKTTPPGGSSSSHQGRRVATSQSSIDFYTSAEEEITIKRPVTAV